MMVFEEVEKVLSNWGNCIPRSCPRCCVVEVGKAGEVVYIWVEGICRKALGKRN